MWGDAIASFQFQEDFTGYLLTSTATCAGQHKGSPEFYYKVVLLGIFLVHSKELIYLPTRSFPYPPSLSVYCYSYATAPNGAYKPLILGLHWYSLRLGSVYMHQYLVAQGEEGPQ
jgi:hypothetical protein